MARQGPSPTTFWLESLAAGGLGLLVGVLVGLAVSPVVGSIVGSLAAVAAAFLAFKTTRRDKAARDDHSPPPESSDPITTNVRRGLLLRTQLVRMIAFTIACLLGVVSGVLLRSYDKLAPSQSARYESWKAIGFSPEDSRKLVAFHDLGYVPGEPIPPEGRVAGETTDRVSGALVNAKADACGELKSVLKSSDPSSIVDSFKARGGDFEIAAITAEWIPKSERTRFLTEIRKNRCS